MDAFYIITQKPARQKHNLHLEEYEERPTILLSHLYNPIELPRFTIKIIEISIFIMIFMIKTIGGVYIQPDISMYIHDIETLRTLIESPNLT